MNATCADSRLIDGPKVVDAVFHAFDGREEVRVRIDPVQQFQRAIGQALDEPAPGAYRLTSSLMQTEILGLGSAKTAIEIQAETAGTLVKLFVEAGQAVDGGDDLFEVEAAD